MFSAPRAKSVHGEKSRVNPGSCTSTRWCEERHGPSRPARARRDVGDSQLGETTGDETAVDNIHGTSVPWCRETVRSTRR